MTVVSFQRARRITSQAIQLLISGEKLLNLRGRGPWGMDAERVNEKVVEQNSIVKFYLQMTGEREESWRRNGT